MEKMIFVGGDELKEFRKRKKYTQEYVAYQASVSQATVSIMENGGSVGNKSWSKVVMFMLKDDKDYFEEKYGENFVTAQRRVCCWS